jgi:predicted methyltransferase
MKSKSRRVSGSRLTMAFGVIAAVVLSAMVATAAESKFAAADAKAEAGAVHESAIPASKIPKAIVDAVNSPYRPAADRKLDPGRRPEQLLAFWGIRPGMHVADLWAAGGWTTELLACTVGPTGKVYSQNGKFPPRFKKAEEQWKARLKEPGMGNVVELEEPFTRPSHILSVPPGSLDAVIMNMNYHDVVGRGYDRAKINAAVYRALKPGGVYGIVDNSAPPGTDAKDTTTIHRIDEAYEIKDVEKAGFKLVATSNVLRNPNDDRTWLIFKHRGKQDRFVLKFIKPKA